MFASLDHISQGRAAWNAVTTANAATAANFGTTHPDHARRYEMADEFLTVVKGLWDGWSDEAIVADRAQRALHRSGKDCARSTTPARSSR